ncbi:uncharacterized protein LOC132797561 [Drosophila nasuta]|uniref:uncharacterized protein LOC132797561 n=1 Tax=Drosophila nasuta TaxID=42062 RepID=UPI00295EA51D|nr:uncharacterized protein LOC132797561 [Drosophila nasuta]
MSNIETSEAEAELLAKFLKLPRVARSPQSGGPASAPPKVDELVFSFDAGEEAATPKRAREDRSPGVSSEAVPKKIKIHRSLQEAVEELGELIDGLIKTFTPREVRHVTQINKNTFARIKTVQIEMAASLKMSAVETVEQVTAKTLDEVFNSVRSSSTQTSPSNAVTTVEDKRKTVSSTKPISKQRIYPTVKNKAEKESVRQDTEGRNTTNKPPRRRRRPDAIIIQPTDGISYSEVLKLVTRSNDSKLQSVGEQVRRVRKTAGDGLILEMGMNSKPSMLKMKDELSEALGLKAKVRALTQETILEIRDIDCLVSKEDVLVACEKLSQANLELSAIKALRPGFDGMQLAIVSMPKEAASSILQNGKIRIGWTSCRVRERGLRGQKKRGATNAWSLDILLSFARARSTALGAA